MKSAETSPLSDFGRALSNATRLRDGSFTTSTQKWPDEYSGNLAMINRLKATLAGKPNVLVVGAGKQAEMAAISKSTQGWLHTGVHWTNFHPEINVNVITSTHTCTLEAAMHSNSPPLLLIHGVYSKVPPLFKRSFVIRWSDPFMSDSSQIPNAKSLEKIIQKKAVGPAPYLPSVRNTLFLNTMVMIWLGAKRIVFTGVDPHHPDYFFTGNSEIVLEIARCLTLADPWLAEWDGRNERIGVKKRETSHRVQQFIKNVLTARSAVGDQSYINEFDRGF
mgnify:CR=1 FL=1